MNCREWAEQFAQWLDSDWEAWKLHRKKPVIPPSLKNHARECPRCRQALKAAMLLTEGKNLQESPPPGLVSRVNEAILQEKESFKPVPALVHKIKNLLAPGYEGRKQGLPRWVLVPAAAAASFAVAVMLMFTLIQPHQPEMVKVHLTLKAPEASRVAAVGDWNDWDPSSHRMSDKNGDGVWEITIKVRPGTEYRYQFLINGDKWVPDPNAPMQVNDGFGGADSILQI
ncbi:MAG: isoamylase early set domain-containing protein [Spirochaetota bacterium]